MNTTLLHDKSYILSTEALLPRNSFPIFVLHRSDSAESGRDVRRPLLRGPIWDYPGRRLLILPRIPTPFQGPSPELIVERWDNSNRRDRRNPAVMFNL